MPIIHFIFWCKIRSRINKYKYAKGRTTIIAQQSKPISCSRAGSLHKPSGFFLTVFPNFLTSGDCMSSIRIYGLQSCKNIEISNIAENWKMIKYIYFTMCYFFPRKKVNAENSSLKNKIKRLVRSSLFDTLTLDFVSLRAFDKIKLHVIYVLDGRHGFWPVSSVKISV